MPRPLAAFALAAALLSSGPVAAAPAGAAASSPFPPPLTEQMRVRDGWLELRHARLLEQMRRHGVGMWIVVNEEFHDDPLTPYVAPARPYVGGRDLFVFVDAGERGLRKVAITGFFEEQLARFFEAPADPKPAKEVLPALVAEHQPKTIAIATGGKRGATRSLGWDSRAWLEEILGAEAARRFVPAEPLIEEYLDTRLAEELPVYEKLVEATETLARRALSGEVIVPGETTVGDVRRFLYDESWRLGFGLWFQPDLRVQRQGLTGEMSRGFLAVSPESRVIERGDLVHLDFGLTLMGLSSDWQKMAYVLRAGESEPPAGIRAALGRTNRLQDALVAAGRAGRPAGEVYAEVMAEMEKQGIVAQVYSHPLGAHGHGLGPSIDFRAAKEGNAERQAKRLRPGSYLAVELNTRSAIPEWDGQEVFVMEEDPAWLSDTGYIFFRPRQESFYLVP